MTSSGLQTDGEGAGLTLDLDHLPPFCWPGSLKPLGDDTWEREAFEPWWARHSQVLGHLPPDLCEQWVHRHWKLSPYAGLPLETLGWTREKWDGEYLLGTIYRAQGGSLSPTFDYNTFQRQGGDTRLPTALALDNGTWDYPMVLLKTSHGVVDLGVTRPLVRFVLIEGHQRHRYLNALHALGRPPAGPHEVLILTSPVTAGAS